MCMGIKSIHCLSLGSQRSRLRLESPGCKTQVNPVLSSPPVPSLSLARLAPLHLFRPGVRLRGLLQAMGTGPEISVFSSSQLLNVIL